MAYTVQAIKDHLIGLSHGGTLNKVRNIEAMFERAASTFLLKIKPLESVRSAPLTSLVHDDIYNYAVTYDFGSIIDLIPQDNRTNWDNFFRNQAGQFDLEKAIRNRTVSVEGSEGTKIIRINWRSRKGKVYNQMDSLTANGTWSVVGSATGLIADSITKYSGAGSIRFNVPTTGGGIQNTTMTAVDLTTENGVADQFIPIYLGSDYANLTSITSVWGNDVTTKYWTSATQTTQADGTGFKYGWNILKFPWSTATQTGTNTVTAFDSQKLTFATTGALSNIRVDNIIFSIGRNFDLKYYSKYLYKSATSGLWIPQPTSDNDYVMIDTDTLPIYLMELLKAMAHQTEGADSTFDINFAENELKSMFPSYAGMYPNMAKKSVSKTGGLPGRGRW